jgi:polyisoprenoid-binding protein YceI
MKKILPLLALLVMAGTARAADTYVIDPTHSFPSFEIDHLGFSTFRGRFDKTQGTITLDLAKKSGTADVTIDVASVSTGVDKLNEHLLKDDFFDVAKYPTIRFTSKDFRFEGDRLVAVKGDLSMHGVTRPVTLTVTRFACKEHPLKKIPACGADAHTTIRRSEWGISTYSPSVGESVKLLIEVEAHRQP